MEQISRDSKPVAVDEIPPSNLRECFGLAEILEDELAGRILQPNERETAATEWARLAAVQAQLHRAERSAICLSGGGIRSATFALGVVQALAKRGLLTRFDYLSTVSGGGYLGGWLSAWIKNAGDLETVARGLNKDLRTSDDTTRDPESEPIRHLRRYSNYLTPKLGFFSSDTWTLIATVLRNIFLNWLMLIPILAGVLMIPRVFASLATREATTLGLTAYVLGLAMFYKLMATTYSALDLPAWRKLGDAKDAPESHATDGGYTWFFLIPAMLTSLLVSLGWFWFVGSFPDDAKSFDSWTSPRGAWVFVYAVVAASFPAGPIAMLLRRHRLVGTWREPLAMLATGVVGGAALWWVLRSLFANLVPYQFNALVINYLCFAPSLVMLIFLLMNFIYVVTFSRSTHTEDREWWARSAGWLLVVAFAWALVSSLVLWGPIGLQGLLQDRRWIKTVVAALGGATGICTALLGYSPLSAAKKKEDSSGISWLAVGAIIFILFLLVAVSFATSWLEAKIFGVPTTAPTPKDYRLPVDYRAFYSAIVVQMEVWKILVLGVSFCAAGLLVGFLVNVNQFSLHAMYKARLTRAYLGASRANRGRAPHWFTGFDSADKIGMHELAGSVPRKLFHVVNIALNLVSGKELAWQERKAQSFTVSPLHSGSWLGGYRASRFYDGGIELGTAITISGAAANPNMGYHSSPLVAILMTLFNVRLGWWAGNPSTAGEKTWFRKGPRHAALPLLAEAFGYTTSDFQDVNLSDGGHFENLGLYEMILRRCQRIVVIDAGRDTDYVFEDLGNALRKIRVDFGIRIEIGVSFLEPNEKKTHLARCVTGQIRYDEVDAGAPIGKLIYIKPLLQNNEPVDVQNYAAAHPGFPHETTGDQWFSESQLESYRMLGFHTMNEIVQGGKEAPTMDEFFAQVEAQSAEIAANLKKQEVTVVRLET
ncbi:MAG: patatin-like phospholipase family protein [Verrucomicrobiota bacterium]|nr:patatin-like phospholipase family protein [Verrucomicrobiota bacterium]